MLFKERNKKEKNKFITSDEMLFHLIHISEQYVQQ